jgi:hypothetical protein
VRHQANFRVSLALLRRSTLSKICAAVIVVLAASPFTAPFSTRALADLTGEAASHEGFFVNSKIADDTTTVDIVTTALVVFTAEIVRQSTEFTYPIDLRPRHITVLRL